MTRRSTIAWTLALALLGAWAPASAQHAGVEVPAQLEGVTTVDRRGGQVDLSLTFTDERGEEVALSDYFAKGKPVLLTLNYYQCTMLCNEMLNGLAESLRGLDWTPGDQFQIVTVSIDPREGTPLASGKRETYLQNLDREGADWHFLTGTEASIHPLAEAVGFRYKYDAETDQFAHPPAVMFLSPDGRVMQYLFGKTFKPRDLKFALMDASEGRVGSTFEQLVWSCFHLDEDSGEYTPFALGIMRLGGSAVAIILGLVLLIMWRRDRMRTRNANAAEQMT